MSPTVFRHGEYRFFFFSREESRIHVHVLGTNGEAKFWIEPIVSLAMNKGLSPRKLNELQKIVEKHREYIIKEWKKHFKKA